MAPGTDATASGTFTTTRETIVVDGVARTFTLSVPQSYDPTRQYPLVLLLHGDLQNGDTLRAETYFEKASQGDAIVAYPDGRYASWDLYSPLDQNADMHFMEAIKATLLSRLSIASNRIYMWGQSSGGFFTSQFACRKPGFLRAIGVQSGGAPYEPANNTPVWPNGYVKCVPDEAPVPAIVFHGTADTDVPFASGQFCAGYWAYVNGCTATQTNVPPSPCKRFEGCPNGNQVVFCAIEGATHTLWSRSIEATWDFFKSYR